MEGTGEKAKPRFLLKSDDISLIFEGVMKDSKTCEFTIPRLDGMFKASKADAIIEVIVENRYFKPWSSEVKLEAPIRVKITESAPKKKIEHVRVSEPQVRTKKTLEVRKDNPIKYKNKKGVIEEVFVLKILEDSSKKVIFEAIDANGKRKRITLPR